MDPTSGSDRQIFGTLGSVSLNDIIQLLGMSKRTATLELRSGEARGRLYFRDGQIIHASAGSYEGEESYLELLGWADAEFAIEEGIAALPKVSITKSTEALLLSTATTLDEIDRLRETVPIRVSPSIVDKRRPPRPKKRRRGPPTPRFYFVTAGTLLAACCASAAIAWVGLGLGGSGESLWRQLPTIASPTSPSSPSSRPSRFASSRFDEAWKIASSASNLPAVPAAESTSTTSITTTTLPAPVPGNITIVVEPWARIEIDGVAAGETPLGKLTLGAGAHRITLINDHIVGHIQDNIVIAPGESVVKRYSFGDVGYLRLVATPWANVSVDGRLVGQTPLGSVAVPVGSHAVHFDHPDLGETSREVEVLSEQTTLVRVQLQ